MNYSMLRQTGEQTPAQTLSDRTASAMQDFLSGRRRGVRGALLFAGPAVITSIAYMDPGNFATNIQAGAQNGYDLLWVVLGANLVAMLFQSLSAKLGIATGRDLAELCRTEFPPPVTIAMWIVSELAAMATDLAEFLGGAIGLSLLCGLPLILGMLATAALTYLLLSVERRGFRPMELMIGALVGVIGLCYLAEMFIAPVSWGAALRHSVTPMPLSADALTIAVGIVGATVMPHALFLHSGLCKARMPSQSEPDRRALLRFSNIEVVVALSAAGLINMAIVMMASAAFHVGHSGVADIGEAYRTLEPLLGRAAAGVFLLSLMASGISSSVVGTMAGQMMMQGFVGFQIPLWLRRLVTMAPAFIVVALGCDATRSLMISQVVLSFALPVPMISLILFTRRKSVMGALVNRASTTLFAVVGALAILLLNIILLLQSFGLLSDKFFAF